MIMLVAESLVNRMVLAVVERPVAVACPHATPSTCTSQVSFPPVLMLKSKSILYHTPAETATPVAPLVDPTRA